MRTSLLGIILLCTTAALAAEPADGMAGKIFVGYQGWAAPVIEGTNIKWVHYGSGGKFEPGNSVVDLWPDVSDLAEADRVPTAFKHADGRVAQVFNPESPATVDKHFEWMKTYGIDGAMLQRFAVQTGRGRSAIHLEKVLDNVRKAAEHHGRSWAIMYDLSGLRKGGIKSIVMPDWKRLTGELKIRQDKAYLKQNGKPVVVVWGIGFNDGRDYTLEECLELVKFLKSDPEAGGNTVILGVPYYWRTQTRDTLKDPLLHQIIAEADVVSPWAVGRYGAPAAMKKLQVEVLEPDIKWLNEKKLGYLPVIFPGFSWHNLMKGLGKDSPSDQIPRRGGEFLWAQAVAAKKAGAEMIYIAMFDEIDEGTAIFKVSNDPPVGASPFVPLDVKRSDHYLWLSGEIGKMLRGKSAPGEMPKRAEN